MTNGWDMMYGWGEHGWGVGAWVAMALTMLVILGGVAAIVALLLRRNSSQEKPDPARPAHYEAERILHERFARGEIDETEYTARRSALLRQA